MKKNDRLLKHFLDIDFQRAELQELVDMAAQICQTPAATLGLLGTEKNHLVVRHGIDTDAMPRETSFCQYTVKQEELLIITDTAQDGRFDQNSAAHANPDIRFYAGAPLKLSNGVKVGALCVFDFKPNDLNDLQKNTLKLLARQAVAAMEQELNRVELKKLVEEKEEKNQSLLKIAGLQSHQIRQPLTSIMGLVGLIKEGQHEVDNEWLEMFDAATSNFDNIIQQIVSETLSEKDLKAIRFNKMVEEIDDCAILLLDNKGYIENWNKGAKKIKGYSYKEIVGKHFSEFYTETDKLHKRPEMLLAEAAKNGVVRDEGWRVRKDGGVFWGSIVITAIHDQQNQVIGFTKLTRDLTALTDIRESLKASDALYGHLMAQTGKTTQVGGWQLDLVKNELLWTSVTKEIHGVEPDYVPQVESAINFYKEGEHRDKIFALLNAAIAKGEAWDTELTIINQQGKEVPVRVTGQSNFKEGICTKVYGTFQNANQSSTTHQVAGASARFSNNILNNTRQICIITTLPEGKITGFNIGAELLTGYYEAEVVGKLNIQNIFEKATSDNIEIKNGCGGKATLQDNHTDTYIIKTKNGTEERLNLHLSPMQNFKNEITGYLWIGII